MYFQIIEIYKMISKGLSEFVIYFYLKRTSKDIRQLFERKSKLPHGKLSDMQYSSNTTQFQRGMAERRKTYLMSKSTLYREHLISKFNFISKMELLTPLPIARTILNMRNNKRCNGSTHTRLNQRRAGISTHL